MSTRCSPRRDPPRGPAATPVLPRAILCSVLVATLAPLPASAPAADAPLEIGSRLEPLVDGLLIESLRGARHEIVRPVDRGPVLLFDRPWEGPFCGYATVIRDGERLRLYYRGRPRAGRDGAPEEVTCYAESSDGVRWSRPELDLHEVEGISPNNVILAGDPPFSHNFAPFLDTRPGVDPAQRFKALAGISTSGLVAFVSGDGIRWSRLREEPVFRPEGWVLDSQNVAFWAPREERYVLYYRSAVDGVRAVARATSRDFVTWSDGRQMVYSDTGSTRPSQHLYTSQTHPYFRAPHIYIATAARFLPGRQVLTAEQARAIGVHPQYFRDTSDAVLMTSRGGERFDRTFLEALVAPGIGAENWVSRTGYPALGIVPTGPAEMSLYVNQSYGQETAHVRRYSMRLDGLARVRADWGGGEMLTRPLVFRGRRLLVNFATSAAGSIRVELQDADGHPVPGHSLEEAVDTIGNEIERAVRWKERGEDVGALAGRPVRIRFALRDAEIYALRFAGSPTSPEP